MSRCGDVYENKVTGEYAVVLRGSEDRGEGPGIVHLTARPGAAVIGEHLHPYMIERFTVVTRAPRRTHRRQGAKPGAGPIGHSRSRASRMTGGNASSTEDAHVLVEIDRAPDAEHFDPNRFELLVQTLFGLANDGKVDRKGRPNPLQAAVIARHFADVVVFTSPRRRCSARYSPSSRRSQLCSAIGRPTTSYSKPHGHAAPDPQILAAAGLPER